MGISFATLDRRAWLHRQRRAFELSDPSYSISGFDVNNPWPPVPSWSTPSLAPPPPHSGSDGCGSGGDRGVVDEHLSYAVWQSTYMTGIDFGHWLGQYVAICDPDPPPSHPGVRPFAQERMRSEGFLSAEMAVKRAQEGLSVYGLDERKNYAGVLRRAKPGTPALVQRLDHPDQFYYIVPVTEDERTAPLAIVVDALTGIYLQSAINPNRGQTVLHRNQARRRVGDDLQGVLSNCPTAWDASRSDPKRCASTPIWCGSPAANRCRRTILSTCSQREPIASTFAATGRSSPSCTTPSTEFDLWRD